MKVLIVLAVLVAAIAAASVPEAILKAAKGVLPGSRIINGDVAELGQFPYQVGLKLYWPGGKDSWCGGTLISDRWVLTAAHCTDGVIGVDVHLGFTNLSDPTEPFQKLVYAEPWDIIVHADWDPENHRNDLSLIRLPESIEFNAHIQPAKLPSKWASFYENQKSLTSGWGFESDTSGISQILRWIEVTILPNNICDRYFGGFIESQHICIRTGPAHKSTCSGDSGGPLVLAGTNTLIGATSFGFASCDLGFPVVFVRISMYLDWIEKFTGISDN